MPTVARGEVELGVDRKGFDDELDKIGNGTEGVGRSIGGRIGSAIGTAMAAGVAGVGIVGGFGLKAAADFQQTEAAMTGLLGSTEKADAFLDKLRKFAAQTPFETPGLAKASQQLLGYGYAADEIIPMLTKVGNVAANLGVGNEAISNTVRALGQMKGKGKIQAEELNQISEAVPGFNAAAAIAQGLGVNVSKVYEAMQPGNSIIKEFGINADQAIQMILNGMEKMPGAAGAMERQSKTLNGVMSTMKDSFRDALIDGISPFLPAMAELGLRIMPMIGPAVSGVINAIVALGQAAVPVFSWLIANAPGAFNAIRDAARPVIEWIRDAFPPVLGVLRTAFQQISDIISGSVVPAFERIFGFLRDNIEIVVGIGAAIGVLLVAAMVTWIATTYAAVTAQLALALAVAAAHAPLIIVAVAIGALVAAFIYAYRESETFRSIVDGVVAWLRTNVPPAFEAIREAAMVAFGWLRDNIPGIMAAIRNAIVTAVTAIVGWWRTHWEDIRAIVDMTWTIISGVVRTAVDLIVLIIQESLRTIEAFWRTWGGTITSLITGIFDGLRQVIEGALTVIRGIADVIMGLIRGDFDRVWHGILQIFSGVWAAINGVVDAGMAAIRAVIETVMRVVAGVFDAIWTEISNAVSAAWGRMRDLTSEGLSQIRDFVADWMGRTRDEFAAVWNAMLGILQTVWRAIVGTVDAAIGFIRGIIDGQMAMLSAAWQIVWWAIEAAVREVRDAIGGFVGGIIDWVRGLYEGVRDWIERAVQAAENGARRIRDAVKGAVVDGGLLGQAGISRDPRDWFRAEGGPISARTPYIVGERGPELIVPDHSGTVIPTLEGLGGGPTYILQVNGTIRDMDDIRIRREFSHMEMLAGLTPGG